MLYLTFCYFHYVSEMQVFHDDLQELQDVLSCSVFITNCAVTFHPFVH